MNQEHNPIIKRVQLPSDDLEGLELEMLNTEQTIALLLEESMELLKLAEQPFTLALRVRRSLAIEKKNPELQKLKAGITNGAFRGRFAQSYS